jgi:hypothetical protein
LQKNGDGKGGVGATHVQFCAFFIYIKAWTADSFLRHSCTQMDEDYICFREHCSILPEMKKEADFLQILLYVPE